VPSRSTTLTRSPGLGIPGPTGPITILRKTNGCWPVARIATVDAGSRARWVVVATGLSDAGRTEILRPPLAPGTRVIVGGQVGLPDGAPVAVTR